MDKDIQQKVQAAIAAGAPREEAIKRGMALQQQRSGSGGQTAATTQTPVSAQKPESNLIMDLLAPFIKTGKNIGGAAFAGGQAIAQALGN